jgi:FkbH-like protein
MSHSITELPWLPTPPEDFLAQCKAVGSHGDLPGPALQFLASFRLNPRQSLAVARAIARCRANSPSLAPLSEFRLGVLASATFDLLLDCVPAAAARHGVALDLVSTAYDQVMQQALDPRSFINTARLDAVLVAVDHRWLNLARPNLTEAGHVTAAVQRVRAVIDGLRKHGDAPAIVQTLPMPPETLFGSYDRRMRGTVRAMIDEANGCIITLAEETGSYLLDTAGLAERVGTDRWFDPVQWVSYKLPFSADCSLVYADMLGKLLGAIRGKARKCLVLDLDNTIWGGVIGDDGLENIHIGQGSPRGEAFLSIQQAAVELHNRGIMLAVCSKNDDAVARGPFRNHPDMILRENHIAVFQANWIDKASNLEAIAKKLNIGLDALVLLDDNPAERAQIRSALPIIAVPELPNDPCWFAWYLNAAGYFEAVSFSAEDRLRADSYASDAQRAEVRATARNLGDYLASLGMVISFSPFDEKGRQRVAQLVNKTNQFNLTTRRYTEAEIAALELDESVVTLQVRLEDKFSDLGMIGVVICRCRDDDEHGWDIESWLMSCRVLGRRVEEAMLAKLATEIRRRGGRRLIGHYFPTAKNSMVADHYQKLGFRESNSNGASTAWELMLSDYCVPSLPMRFADNISAHSDAAE